MKVRKIQQKWEDKARSRDHLSQDKTEGRLSPKRSEPQPRDIVRKKKKGERGGQRR